MYFEFPGDHTKYIHCDVWGHPWENKCQEGMSWEQDLLTCVPESTYNPCLHHVPGTPYLYPHDCDTHKYIHCDTNHESFIQSCQLDYLFLPDSQTCVPPGFPGSENLYNTCNGYSLQPAHIVITTPLTAPGSTSSNLIGYPFSSSLWVTPCNHANVAANNLYFAYRYDNKKYIQCDLNGRQYLKDCSAADPYYDPYSHTCVDGPVFVDGLIGKK